MSETKVEHWQEARSSLWVMWKQGRRMTFQVNPHWDYTHPRPLFDITHGIIKWLSLLGKAKNLSFYLFILFPFLLSGVFHSFSITFFKGCIYLFLERGKEGEREGEKHCLVAPRPLPPTLTTNRTCNLGMCPSQESNQQSFSLCGTMPKQLGHTDQSLSITFCTW